MSRKILKLFIKICLAMVVPAFLMGWTYCIDPLQFYRVADWYMPRFYPQERYQNPAIARTHEYDMVIVGTSMSENISLDKLKKQYGVNAIRQTFAGSSVYEQRMGLEVAIGTGQVKKVIWELNFTSFGGEIDKPKDSKMIFPEYLYNKNPLDDVKYLLDPVQMGRAWQIYRNPLPYSESVVNYEHEILNKWENWFQYGEEYVLADFAEMRAKGELDVTEKISKRFAWEKIYDNLQVNIFDIVGKNPNIEFTFYLAPFSVLEHVAYKMQGIFDEEMKFRAVCFYQLSRLANTKLFDFQGDKEVVENLNYYKDKMHYNRAITNNILWTVMTFEGTPEEQFEENQVYLRTCVQK